MNGRDASNVLPGTPDPAEAGTPALCCRERPLRRKPGRQHRGRVGAV